MMLVALVALIVTGALISLLAGPGPVGVTGPDGLAGTWAGAP
jgi:hypothetical protein